MRKGFTLVELIFVIVIIGILAAAAIPQFTNLKQSAEANNIVKTTIDTASSAASAAVNQLDLEETAANDVNLSNLVRVNGKGWTYVPATGGGEYRFRSANGTADVAQITLNAANRTVSYGITCANFDDSKSATKCADKWDITGTPAGTIAAPIVLTY